MKKINFHFRKNKITFIFAFILFLASVDFNNAYAQENMMGQPVTVDSVDLERYAGKWYEIAKIPNRFQKQCIKNTSAEYKLLADGRIEVVNSCVDEDGELDNAEGMARVADTSSNAKLEVSFVSLFGFHLFWGDYWIIGLDKNYRFAVVGTPSRKYGWILYREKTMPENLLEQAYIILEENGYNRRDFKLSRQE
ncbi:MAG: lipocalin family protein [Calditrichaceae bacterium]|nr:lipocalin family protein [Calditrichaceae bacterium]MBN2707543.1 lipocalin family protein [Calditrichaceae bacterium]